ncbi:hypothetical protein N7474_009714 [Penicillium riverlandense]|uniref:uncharacterized protein n=1 Tax=Penicillium riverlandense TaxID=1903569 RepID=UPI0025493F31|nr:uncharacterized protein N7474_009714 [Penicillium riverlandense]KAJ5808445.1 hypothetical protein N7474_009714 [Penicillium riverlandense]
MSEILVITCPSGKQCAHLIPLLYNKGNFVLRLAAHSETSKSNLKSLYPDAEIVHTDITSQSACRELLSGATTVYHVGPSLHSRETEMGINMIDAAVSESQKPGNVFKHFVFSSVLSTQHRNLMQHDLKCRVEERLLLSPLNFTILQPTNFMDAYPVTQLAGQDSPSIQKLWNPHIPNSVIALRDLAEAAAIVLNEREKHYFAQYPLVSTLPVADKEIVSVIGRHIGKPIEITAPNFEDGVEKAIQYLFGGKQDAIYTGDNVDEDLKRLAADGDLRPDITRDEAERLVLFYNRRGLRGNPNVLRWLLGREPTSVEEWVRLQLG